MRDFAAEQRVREFLSSWGPTVSAEATGIQFPDFEKQCDSFYRHQTHRLANGRYPVLVILALVATLIAGAALMLLP